MRVAEEYGARLRREHNVSAAEYRADVVLGVLDRAKADHKHCEILDVGCGPGVVLNRLREAGYQHLSGADTLKGCVDELKAKGFLGYQIDLNHADTGLPEKKFDVILILEVLEHLYDPAAALKVLRERLTARGLLIASVPNEYRLRKRLSMLLGREIADPALVGGHIKFFSFHAFRRLVESQGFGVVEHFGAGGFKLSKLPFGPALLRNRPDLFSKWSFIAARAG